MQEFEAAREDIKNKNTEDLNVMKITLESTIDELEKKFEISHEAYLMQVCYSTWDSCFMFGKHSALVEFDAATHPLCVRCPGHSGSFVSACFRCVSVSGQFLCVGSS